MDAATWLDSGERVPVELASGRHDVFVRVAGRGPWLTFLHAFPTSSWDWSQVTPLLERQFRTLAFDFLGCGESDKPYPHQYSIFEQADLVEALWERIGAGRTAVVAHDYGATVAQELLARQGMPIDGVVLMNAALYAELARPLPVQRLLARPRLGRLLAACLGERAFRRSISSISRIARQDIDEQWKLLRRRNGTRVIPSLLRYMTERRENAARWEATLEQATVPIHLVWGMNDPRSGRRVAEYTARRIRRAHLVPIDAGHYPQLEAPEAVAEAITTALSP